jgi:hypothetical protein
MNGRARASKPKGEAAKHYVKVPLTLAKILEEYGAVIRWSARGQYAPTWAVRAAQTSAELVRKAATDPELQAKLAASLEAEEAEIRRLAALKHGTRSHEEHAALLRQAFPRHPYLVLRALSYVAAARLLFAANHVYADLFAHVNEAQRRVGSWKVWYQHQRGSAEKDALLRQVAVLLKGLPVGAKLQ